MLATICNISERFCSNGHISPLGVAVAIALIVGIVFIVYLINSFIAFLRDMSITQ